MVKTKRLTLTAMLTGIAVAVLAVESQIPPIVPVPGVKLGLANAVTLFAMAVLSRREAFLTLAVRIILSCVFSGGMSMFVYSVSGGVLSFAVMCAALKRLGCDKIWAVSVFGAAAHNVGQLAAACAVTGNAAVMYYLPALLISGIVTGLFTGMCTYYILKNKYVKRICAALAEDR